MHRGKIHFVVSYKEENDSRLEFRGQDIVGATPYERYGKFGDDTFRGDNITLKNIDKWFQGSGAFGDKFSTAESSIAFKKIAG